MKTIADFKRALTIGSVWHTYNHLYQSDMGNRQVACVKSTQFGFLTERGTISYCDFPKKEQFKVNENGAVEIYLKNGQLILTYTKQ